MAYDWREWEARWNAMGPQFTLELPEREGSDRRLRLHYFHRPAASADAPALLLAHGWPGSVWEFHHLIEPLSRHFHVVAPSIPGYGWSSAPTHRGFSAVDAARSFHALMAALGYGSGYLAHGGDWGSRICAYLGTLFPEVVRAIHITMPIAVPPRGFDLKTLTPLERSGGQSRLETAVLAGLRPHTAAPPCSDLDATYENQRLGTGYQSIQATKPQTLAYALTDSPVGLLA